MKKFISKISGFLLIGIFFMLPACNKKYPAGTFGNDLQLLKEVEGIQILVLGSAQVAVAGSFQGRVLTSTSKGPEGSSYGWFNRKMFADGTYKKRYSALGGEDRMWFGPEIGKYSVFFKPNTDQIPANIAMSPALDSVDFKLIRKLENSVTYGSKMSVINYRGFEFKVEIERQITILDRDKIEDNLGVKLPSGITQVGFEVKTSMKNIGSAAWQKSTGLLSIWDIGCMAPSKKAIVLIPTKGEIDSVTEYFSPLDSNRVRIADGIVHYKADAQYLNKIGIQARNIKPIFGSYNPDLNLLTIIQFNFDNDSLYVNSNWENQIDPYAGDVINVFNDGTTKTAGPFGPFYELETSSSAKELKVGESQRHLHTTYHFEGAKENLNPLAKVLLGTNLLSLVNIFPEQY